MTYFPYKPRAHHCRQIHCKSHSDAPKHPPCSESALDANLPVHAGKYCVRCLLQAPRRGETAPAFGDPGAPRGDVSYLASQAPEVAWEPLCVDGGGGGAAKWSHGLGGRGVWLLGSLFSRLSCSRDLVGAGRGGRQGPAHQRGAAGPPGGLRYVCACVCACVCVRRGGEMEDTVQS